MRSSDLEGSVIHTHGDDTSIFPVSKQIKLKLFWPTTDRLQAFVYKKHGSNSGHFHHTAGQAVALKLYCIPFVVITQGFIQYLGIYFSN
jgi:hypothetical protein